MAPIAYDDAAFPIPPLFAKLPRIQDDLSTETLSNQRVNAEDCLPFLKGVDGSSRSPFDFNEKGIPSLRRKEHIKFLHDSLEDYPANFVTIDASRPWLLYWALTGLYLLGEDVTQYREGVIKTFAPMQDPKGGFGGGHGQYAHLASSYAAVLCLAMVGGDKAYNLIDREGIWRWLGRLKQANGGFQVCEGGEEDVRGAYCAMVLITLLDLPLDLPAPIESGHGSLTTFHDGLEGWLARCQTFEGGIAGAPGNEAHGAYAFCALACLGLVNGPQRALQCLHVPSLLSWLSSRQYAPEGGYSGRTNKLVDGCYSHWVGGCWPLIEASLNYQSSDTELATGHYSREGLTRYILSCCQEPTGGLKDKPSTRADSYHTCYTLAGLSSMQYLHYHSTDDVSSVGSFGWRYQALQDLPGAIPDGILDSQDRLEPCHPLFVIPHVSAQNLRDWSEAQPKFSL